MRGHLNPAPQLYLNPSQQHAEGRPQSRRGGGGVKSDQNAILVSAPQPREEGTVQQLEMKIAQLQEGLIQVHPEVKDRSVGQVSSLLSKPGESRYKRSGKIEGEGGNGSSRLRGILEPIAKGGQSVTRLNQY